VSPGDYGALHIMKEEIRLPSEKGYFILLSHKNQKLEQTKRFWASNQLRKGPYDLE
jgi:hypothetical protein